MKKLFAILFAAVAAPAHAAQYGRDVQQAMALEAAAQQYAPMPDQYAGALPVRVLDATLEKDIRAGNHATSIADLERCKMIWPNGVFAWGAPDSGNGLTTLKPTCLAEVYLKAAPNGQQAGVNGGANDKIVAVAFVPAGGTLKCNIGDFPQSGYLPAAGDVIFPADNPPSIEDVEKVMDAENKQNAVMKTVSAALVGGAGMFFAAGTQDKGKTAALTAAGAVGAGGLAFGSTQVGKVAGDTMLSAGTNAAVGAVMGNMSAGTLGGGDAILVIKDCDGGKCLWGYVIGGDKRDDAGSLWYNIKSKTFLKQSGTNPDVWQRESNVCNPKISGDGSEIIEPDSLDGGNGEKWTAWLNAHTGTGERQCLVKFGDEGDSYKVENSDLGRCFTEGNFYVQLKEAHKCGNSMLAMIELGADQKEGFFGTKLKDFRKNKADGKYNDAQVVGRNPDGTKNDNKSIKIGDKDNAVFFTIANFVPLAQTADDGEVIDFGNKARMGSTLMGAGSGAAVGALASFQNARAEVQTRYISELENYEGTLSRFYCITGTRYLDKYNASVIIPAMK
ncbi:MAG: hypothetical protein LBL46_03875 [Rickettsiales bacterium]|jgi:hypothetical protein|nr:hypothetical protein [Rickettsiales bacterium]